MTSEAARTAVAVGRLMSQHSRNKLCLGVEDEGVYSEIPGQYGANLKGMLSGNGSEMSQDQRRLRVNDVR